MKLPRGLVLAASVLAAMTAASIPCHADSTASDSTGYFYPEGWVTPPTDADILLIEDGLSADGSVAEALRNLGDRPFNYYRGRLLTLAEMRQYAQIIIVMDGRRPYAGLDPELYRIVRAWMKRPRPIPGENEIRRVHIFGGACAADFAEETDTWLFNVDQDEFCWKIPDDPHIEVVNPSDPLAHGLSDGMTFADPRAGFYQTRVVDDRAVVSVRNGDGQPLLFWIPVHEDVIVSVWISSPHDQYYGNAGDRAILSQVLSNMVGILPTATVPNSWGLVKTLFRR